jgi:hypothetical protein
VKIQGSKVYVLDAKIILCANNAEPVSDFDPNAAIPVMQANKVKRTAMAMALCLAAGSAVALLLAAVSAMAPFLASYLFDGGRGSRVAVRKHRPRTEATQRHIVENTAEIPS